MRFLREQLPLFMFIHCSSSPLSQLNFVATTYAEMLPVIANMEPAAVVDMLRDSARKRVASAGAAARAAGVGATGRPAASSAAAKKKPRAGVRAASKKADTPAPSSLSVTASATARVPAGVTPKPARGAPRRGPSAAAVTPLAASIATTPGQMMGGRGPGLTERLLAEVGISWAVTPASAAAATAPTPAPVLAAPATLSAPRAVRGGMGTYATPVPLDFDAMLASQEPGGV